MKTVAIIQSSFIPWRGYFDIINIVDEFILYDDAEYSKNGWRNRNKIKTPQGSQWVTIPILTVGKSKQRILDARVSDQKWRRSIWRSICQNYSKATHFRDFKDVFEPLFLDGSDDFLSQINFKFLVAINQILGIDTKLTWSSNYSVSNLEKSDKVLELCQKADAQEYLTGPSAKDYLNVDLFDKNGIKISWANYADYKPYRQLYGDFVGDVTILDLIFNEGPNAKTFMKSFAAK